MSDKINSIVPLFKKPLFKKQVIIILPYKDKEHLKIVWKSPFLNKMIKQVYKYNFELKKWKIIECFK